MQLTPEQVQSINVLLSAVQVAQRRGAFSLQDAHTLQESIDRLVPREEQERQAAAAAAESDSSEEDVAPSLEESSEEFSSEAASEEDSQPAADSE
tara:strand:- start:364 stop:648 length:285 start_codon:yes stop_codon:yes gene_type:complete